MALIDSPRLTDGDRAHWARLAGYDATLADRYGSRLDRLADQARDHIRQWAAAGPGICGVSWGKDSTVVAHLVATTPGVDVPIVWARADPFETPECELIRDAFLAAHPHTRYEERTTILRNPKRGEPGHERHALDPDRQSQDILKELITERYVSGVRAEESRLRALSLQTRGIVTKNTCRPIIKWTAVDVFAYLHYRRLPVHPVYAMTRSGFHDRRWLRVHPLCSLPPATMSSVHGWDMAQWEQEYYGDVIAAAIASRTHMWTEPRTR